MDRQTTLKQVLRDGMANEIHLLRELLANLHEEQDAVLLNSAATLKQVIESREALECKMAELRENRMHTVMELKEELLKTQGESEYKQEIFLEDLLDCTQELDLEIQDSKKQIVALIEKLQVFHERNSYLLENRVALTKRLIQRLGPEDKNPTYTTKGSIATATKTKTLTLINREG